MIRLSQIWLVVELMDMRAGPDTVLARMVRDFRAAHPDDPYVFINKRVNRMRILMLEVLLIWLATRE